MPSMSVIWLMSILVVLLIASRTGLGRGRWFLLSLFLGPVAILAILVVAGRRRSDDDPVDAPTAQQRKRNVVPAGTSDDERIYVGYAGSVEVTANAIVISRHGTAAFLTHGLKGEKRIPFSSITAVQFRPAGKTLSGYIQFTILGAIESPTGIWDATLDENTVMFTSEHQERFDELRQLVESRIAAMPEVSAAVAGGSVADELAKLADLRDRGVLSDSEFATEKGRLLTSAG